MSQDFQKIFKTPKYTGISLSLLSMFVLASMFVVWEKMPQKKDFSSGQPLQVWAEDCMRNALDLAKNDYELEMKTSVKIQYFSVYKMDEILTSNSEPWPDLFLSTDSNHSYNKMISSLSAEKIPLAYHPNRSGLNKIFSRSAIHAQVSKLSKRPIDTIRFARFLAAPSRGQFYFAQDKWIGVDGDKWRATPEIKILCDTQFKSRITPSLQSLRAREGATYDINFQKPKEIESSLAILNEGQAKQYLPDIIISQVPLLLPRNIYNLHSINEANLRLYYLSKGTSSHLCERTLSTLKLKP
ncbi:MAG: hypothetical protein P8N49_07060 [Opitutales bacterium]|nr:hypothetical protein [Opitutales bacterium]